METVEVVIRIPKQDFDFIKDEFADGNMPDEKDLKETTYYAIANGTVLPKRYGRLIETDNLISHLKAHINLLIRHYADEGGNVPFEINSRIDQIRICLDDIANTPTIIEADEEVENDG